LPLKKSFLEDIVPIISVYIVLSKTTKDRDHTKHINIKYHYLQEKVASLEIEFKYCPTEQMLADVLTKALPKPKASILCRSERIDNSKP
jgi:hypothetical protein